MVTYTYTGMGFSLHPSMLSYDAGHIKHKNGVLFHRTTAYYQTDNDTQTATNSNQSSIPSFCVSSSGFFFFFFFSSSFSFSSSSYFASALFPPALPLFVLAFPHYHLRLLLLLLSLLIFSSSLFFDPGKGHQIPKIPLALIPFAYRNKKRFKNS